MSESHQPTVRRVLVAIDVSPLGSAALEAGARLATELSAELQGLFIEDTNLLRLAGLPFAREIDYASGVARPLETETMERTLRARAEGVRQAIAETARQTSLHWSFRISRGNLAQTMLTESLTADFLLVGRATMSNAAPLASRPRGPVMFVDEGSPASDRVFETAQRLARQHADVIVALVMREDVRAEDVRAEDVRAEDVRAEDVRATARSAGRSSPVYVQQCSASIDALLRAVEQWQPQLLLLDRSSQFVSESTVNSLVRQLPCPLAFVQ